MWEEEVEEEEEKVEGKEEEKEEEEGGGEGRENRKMMMMMMRREEGRERESEHSLLHLPSRYHPLPSSHPSSVCPSLPTSPPLSSPLLQRSGIVWHAAIS